MNLTRRRWLGLGFLFVAFVIFESLSPRAIDAGIAAGIKSGHVIAYGWLMLWYAQAYPGARARIGIALALVLMGVALEFAQGMTGYRSFAYADMRDNALGVAIGLALAWTPVGNVLRAVDRKAIA